MDGSVILYGYGALCFGPIKSRRFGLSLGLDLMGPDNIKRCNFDCLYCELPKGEKTSTPSNLPSILELEEALIEKLKQNPKCDVITLCANGEPTIHPKFREIVLMVKKIIGARPLLVLSNGSTICDENVRKALKLCDIVKLSLDSARSESLYKIDRPMQNFDINKIIDCMILFKKEFIGELVIEILLVDKVNDSLDEIEPLKNALLKINPDKIHISTIARTPAYDVRPAANEVLLKFIDGLRPLVATLA